MDLLAKKTKAEISSVKVMKHALLQREPSANLVSSLMSSIKRGIMAFMMRC
jgi:hypothetical protein